MSLHIRNEFLQAYRDMFGVSMDTANVQMRHVEQTHITERLRLTDLFDPEIESDQFSHQEDAFWAGFNAALQIFRDGMDGFE